MVTGRRLGYNSPGMSKNSCYSSNLSLLTFIPPLFLTKSKTSSVNFKTAYYIWKSSDASGCTNLFTVSIWLLIREDSSRRTLVTLSGGIQQLMFSGTGFRDLNDQKTTSQNEQKNL